MGSAPGGQAGRRGQRAGSPDENANCVGTADSNGVPQSLALASSCYVKGFCRDFVKSHSGDHSGGHFDSWLARHNPIMVEAFLTCPYSLAGPFLFWASNTLPD